MIERAKISVPGTHQASMVAAELRKLPGVDVFDLVRVFDHEYEISLSLVEHLERTKAVLERVAPLGLAAAPTRRSARMPSRLRPGGLARCKMHGIEGSLVLEGGVRIVDCDLSPGGT